MVGRSQQQYNPMPGKLTALLLAAAACQGCFAQPKRIDPLSDLHTGSAPQGPYRDFTLAVVSSKNTLESKAFLERRLHGKFKPRKLFEEVDSVFARNFKKVIEVQKIGDAPSVDADLAALLDIFVQYGGTPDIEATVLFFAPDGEKIETINAKGAAAAFSAWDAGGLLRLAEGEVIRGLESGLAGSQALTAFARTGPAPRTAAPAAPAAPPRREVHSDVDIPRYSLPERADDFALVVGVENYLNELPSAQFAERDARAVRNHLRALGFPQRNIKFFTNQQAVLSALSAYLEDWLPRNVRADSRVFIYFSGHGAPDPGTGRAYLVPFDGDPNFLDKTAYPVKRLYARAGALKARQVIVALDACFSGTGGRSVLPEGARPLVTKVDTSVGGEGKIVLFAAASATQVTATLKEEGHGIFTYYFLKGLSGGAKDSSGAITPRGLYQYLKPQVQDAANRQNRDQTPVLDGAVEGVLFTFE